MITDHLQFSRPGLRCAGFALAEHRSPQKDSMSSVASPRPLSQVPLQRFASVHDLAQPRPTHQFAVMTLPGIIVDIHGTPPVWYSENGHPKGPLSTSMTLPGSLVVIQVMFTIVQGCPGAASSNIRPNEPWQANRRICKPCPTARNQNMLS